MGNVAGCQAQAGQDADQVIERRDLDDMEARLRFLLQQEGKQTRLELGERVRSVGLVPAVLAAIVASLLTTGAVMFMWGIFR